MVSDLARLTRSMLAQRPLRRLNVQAANQDEEVLRVEDVRRVRQEIMESGRSVVTDRNGNRYLVERRTR